MSRALITLLTYIFHGKPLLTVLVVLVLASLQVLSLYGLNYMESLYRVYDTIYPLDSDAVANIVVTSDAVSPLTSIVNLELIKEKLGNTDGIKIQPVFVTVGLVYDVPVIVYETFANDTCSYPDQGLLSRVSANVGDFIPIQSLFTSEVLFLKICGVGEKPGIGVSYSNVARIRGVKPGYYSFIVVSIYDVSAVKDVYRALGLNASDEDFEKLVKRAFLVIISRGSVYELREAQGLTEVYLARFGVYRDFIVYLAYLIALTVLVGLPVLGLGVVELNRRELELFIVLGTSKTTLLFTLLVYTATLVVMSTMLSILIIGSGLIPQLVFMGYTIPLKLEYSDTVYVALIDYLLCTLGVLAGLKRIEAG